MNTTVQKIINYRGILPRLQEKEQTLRRKIWQRWNNPAGKTTPVFLVGCGRSGTSMLVFHLNKSRRVELYNENSPAAFENFRLRDFGRIEQIIEDSYAPFVVFKPILDTHRTNLLLERFPGARILFTFRHFDDVINSSLKKFGVMNRITHVNSWMEDDFSEFASAPPPASVRQAVRELWKPGLSPESGGALYWFYYNRLFYDLGMLGNDRILLTRYESIVANPEEEFSRICAFMGIPYEPSLSEGVFASSVKRQQAPAIDPEIREACENLYGQLSAELTGQRVLA